MKRDLYIYIQRDLYIWKGTCIYEKRPIDEKRPYQRDLQYIELQVSMKRDLKKRKETHIYNSCARLQKSTSPPRHARYEKRLTRETYIQEKTLTYINHMYFSKFLPSRHRIPRMKRDLQNRRTCTKRNLYVSLTCMTWESYSRSPPHITNEKRP